MHIATDIFTNSLYVHNTNDCSINSIKDPTQSCWFEMSYDSKTTITTALFKLVQTHYL